jgi:hypothetical protein
MANPNRINLHCRTPLVIPNRCQAHVSFKPLRAGPNKVSLAFSAKLGFDSLHAYVVAPHQPSGIFYQKPAPPSTWLHVVVHTTHAHFQALQCDHHLESTPRHCMLKHAPLRHPPRVVMTQKPEHHQHHGLMSSPPIISPFLFWQTSTSIRETVQATALYVWPQQNVSDCNHAPPRTISAQYVTIHARRLWHHTCHQYKMNLPSDYDHEISKQSALSE